MATDSTCEFDERGETDRASGHCGEYGGPYKDCIV